MNLTRIGQLIIFWPVLFFLFILSSCQQTKVVGTSRNKVPQPAVGGEAEIFGKPEIQVIVRRKAKDKVVRGLFDIKLIAPTNFTVETKSEIKLNFADENPGSEIAKMAPVEFDEVTKPLYCDFIFSITYPGKKNPNGVDYVFDIGTRVFLCPVGITDRVECTEEEKQQARDQESINCNVFYAGSRG